MWGNYFWVFIHFILFCYHYSLAGCLNSVENSFENIGKLQQKKIKVASSKVHFPDKFEFRMDLRNKFGVDNHFQGASIIPNTENKFFIISGADKKLSKSWLFFGKLDDETGRAVFLKRFEVPVVNNEWHVGGLALYDDILAVPMETIGEPPGSSTIYFYQIKINQLTNEININKFPRELHQYAIRAGAVSLRKNSSDRYDIINYVWGKFIISYNIDLNSNLAFKRRQFSQNIFQGSNVDLISDCEGRQYMLSYVNPSFIPLFNFKKNIIRLYELNEQDSENPLKLIKYRKIKCGRYCNFSAGVGSIIEDQKIKIFSVRHFRAFGGKTLHGKIFE